MPDQSPISAQGLAADHKAGWHEPGTVGDCPKCVTALDEAKTARAAYRTHLAELRRNTTRLLRSGR